MKYSESETLMIGLQDWVSGWQTQPKWLHKYYISSAQVPAPVPHWLSTMECTFFPNKSTEFSFGLFKNMPLFGLVKFRSRLKSPLPFVSLWWEGLLVIPPFWHAHSFYPFPHFIMTPSQHLVCDLPDA
jgi:hypothetical protein